MGAATDTSCRNGSSSAACLKGGSVDASKPCPHCGSTQVERLISTRLRDFYVCITCSRTFALLLTTIARVA